MSARRRPLRPSGPPDRAERGPAGDQRIEEVIAGCAWMIRSGVVYRDGERLTRAELLALPRDGAVWTWLREHGVRRPSPSGPSGGRPGVLIRMADDDAEALRELARERGETLGETVGALVRENAAKTRR